LESTRWWLICYDVRDDKRLRKAAKLLEGYGERLQYSVFRCWLSGRDAEKLRWELTELLSAEDDVMLIPLCQRCHGGVRVTHAATKRPEWPEEPGRFEIV
jgi:CRISPR-associated protein Cas2